MKTFSILAALLIFVNLNIFGERVGGGGFGGMNFHPDRGQLDKFYRTSLMGELEKRVHVVKELDRGVIFIDSKKYYFKEFGDFLNSREEAALEEYSYQRYQE